MEVIKKIKSYPIYTLQFVALLDLFAIGLIIPLLHAHVRQLGANHVCVGLMGSVYAGFQLASGPFMGSLSDLKGQKTVLVVTLLLCSGAYMCMGYIYSIYGFLFIRAFLGLFKQTQMLTKALVPDYEKDIHKQSEIYGKMAAISGVGITTGPIVGGHIAEDYPEYAFICISTSVGLCFIINAGFVYFLPNVKKKSSNKTKAKGKPDLTAKHLLYSVVSSLKESVLELYKIEWSEYWDVFLFKGLIGFAMGVYYSNYAVYLKTQYDLSPKYIGYVISFQGVVGSLSSYFISYINDLYKTDYDYSQRNFHVFLLLTISMIGLILSNDVFIYIVWLIPMAVGNAVGRLITLEMIMQKSENKHRGSLIGAANSVRSLSGVVAPMVAGCIGQYIGVSYVIYASFFTTLFGSIMSYNVRKQMQRLKEE